MIKRTVEFISSELIYNGHLQSFGASAIVYVAAVLLGYEVRIGLLVLPYLIFQTIYFHDRYQDFYHDYISNKERALHLQKYYHNLPLLILGVFTVTALALIYVAAYAVLIFGILVIVLGILYPIFFKSLTRYIPLFKNIYVASVFALLVFFPAIYWDGAVVVSQAALLLGLFVFVQSLIVQVVLDIKDSESDKKRGLKTLTLLLSQEKVMAVLWSVNGLVLLGAFILLLTGTEYVFLAALAIATFPFNGYMLFKIVHQEKIGFILAAGQYLLWPLILILLSYD